MISPTLSWWHFLLIRGVVVLSISSPMKLSGKEFRKLGVIHLKVDQVDLEFQQTKKCLPVHRGIWIRIMFQKVSNNKFFLAAVVSVIGTSWRIPIWTNKIFHVTFKTSWKSPRFAEDPNYRVAEHCKNDGGRPGVTLGYLKYLKVPMCNNCWTILYSVPALRAWVVPSPLSKST